MSDCGQSAGKTIMKKLSSKLIYYLVGFTDGEGSFNISVINRNRDFNTGWKIAPSFNISQKDDSIPKLFQKVFQCGTIRYRKDGICYFEVRKIDDLVKKVIPFFQKYKLLSIKKNDFQYFSKIISLIKEKEHLGKSGINKILKIRNRMNFGGKHRYSDKEILDSIK